MKPLLLVDGYNVIGAWSEAKERGWTMPEARDQLLHRLCDYAGYADLEIVLVFDGHYQERRQRSTEKVSGVTVVYTKHGESADNYIEAAAGAAPKYRELRVATSDGLEQIVTMGRGAVRVSARELLRDISQTRRSGRTMHGAFSGGRSDIGSRLPPQQREQLERMRRQK
ncbi:NYN domain-containing protein [Beduinella massiliensis]|uniref:NYN domain-containing protein n=1 Tax=Beduinella massiliensis TaxID=1852363 RepID=UPI000C854109